jgi:hypothetical protein
MSSFRKHASQASSDHRLQGRFGLEHPICGVGFTDA